MNYIIIITGMFAFISHAYGLDFSWRLEKTLVENIAQHTAIHDKYIQGGHVLEIYLITNDAEKSMSAIADQVNSLLILNTESKKYLIPNEAAVWVISDGVSIRIPKPELVENSVRALDFILAKKEK